MPANNPLVYQLCLALLKLLVAVLGPELVSTGPIQFSRVQPESTTVEYCFKHKLLQVISYSCTWLCGKLTKDWKSYSNDYGTLRPSKTRSRDQDSSLIINVLKVSIARAGSSTRLLILLTVCVPPTHPTHSFYNLRLRHHPYQLNNIQLSLYKNIFINRFRTLLYN